MKMVFSGMSPQVGALRRHLRIAGGAGALILSALLITAPAQTALAAGDLLVAPTRVVFEGRDRSAEVTLVNKGTETEIFRISMVNRRMLDDGTFQEVEVPLEGEQFAGQMIRYAPRRVTVEPNTPQTIRVQLRKPSSLADGEYRSHMLFRAVPNLESAQSAQAGNDANVFQVNLIPVYGVTIPVIVRHGNLDADVSIDGAELNDSKVAGQNSEISVAMSRTGDKSIYGTLKVMSPTGDRTFAEVHGVAIYTPNRKRIVRIPLNPAELGMNKGSAIRVGFYAPKKSGGAMLAEQQVVIR